MWAKNRRGVKYLSTVHSSPTRPCVPLWALGSGLLSEPWQTFYGNNSLVDIVEGCRCSLVRTDMYRMEET